MKFLVVAAHPDDEVLGCGGTIARLTSEGHQVRVAILGEGVTSRSARREDADPQLLLGLSEKSRAAARLLGADEPELFGLPDNRFDTVPLLEVVKLVESVVEIFSPDVVYTHHGGDLNVDHGIVHRAVLTATRPVPGCAVREVYSFEIPSSTEWAFNRIDPCFRPNVFVDISATLEAKLRAMALYEGESRPFPHARCPEALRAAALRWGSVAGLGSVEPFELIRSVRP